MTRVEQIGRATLYLGSCEDILPTLPRADAAIVSDPPYGMKWDGKVTVGRNGHGTTGAKAKHYGVTIYGDDKPFDPAPWLEWPEVVLFGSNHFAASLPVGTTLIWLKRKDGGFGSFLSDGEMAWRKGGHGVYARRDTSLAGQTRSRAHPTQKPVGIMEWAIEKAGKASTIIDPYMGSGTTGVAAVQMGRDFIGIEREPKYFDAACRRIEQAHNQGNLFIEAAA